MVLGFFKKDGKTRPINAKKNKPVTFADAPEAKETKADIAKMQSARLGKFALARVKEAGGLSRAGFETVKQKKIEKDIKSAEKEEEFDAKIDAVLNKEESPQQKFRSIQRFGRRNSRNLSKDQNDLLKKELARQAKQFVRPTAQVTKQEPAPTPSGAVTPSTGRIARESLSKYRCKGTPKNYNDYQKNHYYNEVSSYTHVKKPSVL